jgi:salicylate hydroxylase
MSSKTSPFTVIIVGGGIAGLSSAIALRGINRKIIVLEQARLNREIGATISLQPNASQIVEKKWGLTEALQTSGAMRDEAFQIFGTDGNLQKTIPLLLKEKYGADRMVYHRQDLHDALKQFATRQTGCGEPAEIRVSSMVVRCDTEQGIVFLQDGSTLKGDLIIGADGM